MVLIMKKMFTEVINRMRKGLLLIAMMMYVTMAWAEDDPVPPTDIHVENATALNEAISGTCEKVILTANIDLTETLVINRDVTLDLFGHTISSNGKRAIWVKAGNVTITANAASTISVSGDIASNSSVIRIGDNEGDVRVTSLTIDEKVTVSTDKCYGITVFGNKTKETLVVNGTVAVTDVDASAISGNGSAGYDGTTITIGEKAHVSSTGGVAIYHPQSGTLTVNGTVSGKGGIEIKAGELIVGDAAKISILEGTAPSHKENTDGTSTLGYAIAIVENNSYAGVSKVSVSPNATFVGAVASLLDSTNDKTTPVFEGLSMDVEILGVKYTLASALQAVAEGGTIKLLADVTVTNPMTISKPLTLDLDGHKITAAGLAENSYAVNVETAGNVVLQNGTIISDQGGIDCSAGNAALNKLTVQATGHALSAENASMVLVDQESTLSSDIQWLSTGSLTVDGTVSKGIEMKAGQLKAGPNANISAGSAGYAIAIIENSHYAGVEVVDVDASASISGAVVEKIESKNSSAAPTVYKGKISMVAETGNVKYAGLADAIAAVSSTETVKLLDDVTVSSTLEAVASMTLDLAGHTLTATGLAENQYVLKAIGCDVVLKDGKIVADNGRGIYSEEGKADFQHVTVETPGYALLVSGAGVVKIDANSTLTSNNNYAVVVWGDPGKNPVLDVYGKIYSTSEALDEYAAISGNGSDESEPVVTIHEGAIVSSAKSSAIYWPNKGTLKVEGGEISGFTGIYAKSGTVQITGGTITGNGAKTAYQYSGGGYHSTGDALVIDNCGYPGDVCKPEVSGGIFISENAEAVASYGYDIYAPVKNFVSGGSFSSQLTQEVCAEGYLTSPILKENGMYGVSTDLVITDVTNWVAPTVEYQIAKATYTRVTGMGVTKYGTVCLPFSITADVDGMTFYKVAVIGESVLTINEITDYPIAAGTPVIFELSEKASTMTISSENATVSPQPAQEENGLVGTYAETDLTTGLSKIYYLNGDAFHQADTKVTVPAFRAYVKVSSAPAGAPTRAKSLAIQTLEATGLESVWMDDSFDAIYDLQGNRQENLQEGFNVMKTKDGRTIKVFVNKK